MTTNLALPLPPEAEVLSEDYAKLLQPLSASQRHYLAVLAAYGDRETATKAAGISKKTPITWAHRSKDFKAAQSLATSLHDESFVVQLAKHQIKRATAVAATGLVTDATMDARTDAQYRTRHQAQRTILDIAGVLPKAGQAQGLELAASHNGLVLRMWQQKQG